MHCARRKSSEMAPLDALFHARSVALIGISADPNKMTGAPISILKQTGFVGKVFPVNPKYADIGGFTCYPSIDALPEAADVALITLAAARVPDAIRACARKGIRAAVVLSSGFEETEEGAEHARALARAAAETGVAVVGPNCEGVWSVRERVLLTFGSAARREVLHFAPIAVLSQSGAMAGALARHLQDSAVGCAYVVSVGNETVLTIADYLEWMIAQDHVRVVLLFIEGLRDGRRLLELIERATARGIHVVALKSGNSVEGLKAAASHTGKMASPYAVYHDLLAEAGAIQVASLTDLIDAAEVLSVLPLPPQRGTAGGVAVFSIPGGTRAMTADALEEHGAPLSTFERATVRRLADALPDFGGTENPTDLTGQVLSHPGLFDQCLRIIAQDANTEALIVQVANRGPRDVIEREALLADVIAQSQVPMVVSFLGDALPASDKARLRAAGIVCARDPAEAARFLGWLYAARHTQLRHAESAAAGVADTQTAMPGANSVLDAPCMAPHTWDEVTAFLQACGIGVPAWRIVGPGDDAQAVCQGLRFPVAVKALPQDADHKTELGAVLLGVGAAELAARVATIRDRLNKPYAGVLVQQMDAGGIEVLLSALRNPDFGPVLAVGLGGTATELYGDVAYVALPTSRARVQRAVARLKLWKLLQGFRGKPAADLDALLNAACVFGARFAAAQPRIGEMEINPLFVRERSAGRAGSAPGVVAVDALVKMAPGEGGMSPAGPLPRANSAMRSMEDA
jgi:acyl-CoA synthetase (NDP forming)